jgi:hypothetical protein
MAESSGESARPSDAIPEAALASGARTDAGNGQPTREEVVRVVGNWLQMFIEPGCVTEVRALEVAQKWGRPCTASGYFDYDHLNKAADESLRLSGISKGVYFCPNPITPDLLGRRANRVERAAEGDATADKHVLRRRWLLIDADPVRDAKISASNEEKALAWTVILAVRDFLRERGWPEPILADSGNGFHLDYRVDLPADDGGLVKRVLLAVSQRFSTAAVSIDQSVANPSRLCKLYGTMARKGDNVPEIKRIHRRSVILEVPGCADTNDVASADVRVVPAGLLETLAAEAQEEAKPAQSPGPRPSANGYNHRLDVPKWLAARGLDFRIKGTPASSERTVYLITCPFDTTHAGGDTCVMQEPSGKMSAHCFHNACSGRGWQEFKERIGKPDPDHYDPPMGRKGSRRPRRQEPAPEQSTGVVAANAGPDEGSPVIVVNDRQLPAVTADALEAVRRANNPPRLFQRGGALTRLRIDRKTQAPSLQVMNDDAVRGCLARVAAWMRVTEEAEINVPPPMAVVRDIIALDEWEDIPPLHAVIETPVFAADGRLISTPGYDAASCLYYRPARNLEIPAVPEKPTADDIRQARTLLLFELMGDFPFNDGPGPGGVGVDGDSSKATALAAVLLSFVRELIDGPTPFHLFDAPVEGTGKTLLVTSVSVVGVGRAIDGMAEATSDEEWRKRITAALVEGPTFLFLDNLNRTLDSGAVASALTATTWKDRVLGSTRTVTVPNNAVWLGSGNNTKLSRELIRRTVWCRLDARTDAPWERTKFRHKHLTRWATANRGRLVWAALTLCQAWMAAGRPAGQQTMGMFEAWVEVIGGILDVAGVPGLLANATRFRAAATDKSSEWREFVAAWWARYAGEKVGVDGLFALAVEQRLLDSVLGDKGERSQRTKLGMALSKARDRVIGDYRVVWAQEDNSSRQTYRLEPAPKEQATGDAPRPSERQEQAPDDEEFEMEG